MISVVKSELIRYNFHTSVQLIEIIDIVCHLHSKL